jgi:predicted DNA-binding protein (UPF0251 family)
MYLHLIHQSKYMATATSKPPKSVVLSKDELKALRKYFTKFLTGVRCAETIGIHRNVLDRVLVMGRGSVETIGKIRIAISEESVEA